MNTNTAPSIFKFHTVDVRTSTLENGEPLFCAKDVCQVLGYVNDSDAVKKHCKVAGVVKRDLSSGGQMRELSFITEGNLYRLIVKSRKPEAEAFEAWVMDEVLPAIRKTGSYAIAPSAQDNAPAPRRNARWVNDEKDIDRRIHVRAWQLAGLFMDKWISDMHTENQYHSFMTNDYAVEAWTPSFGATDAIETLDMLSSIVATMSKSARAKDSDMTKLLEASINMNGYETRRAA